MSDYLDPRMWLFWAFDFALRWSPIIFVLIVVVSIAFGFWLRQTQPPRISTGRF